MIEEKEQKTCESCLPVSLIVLMREKGMNIGDEEEMNILVEGLKKVKSDYTIGQLIYFCERFPKIKVNLYIDFEIYYKTLLEFDYPENMELINEKINRNFLKKKVEKGSVIVYVDKYYTNDVYHAPHFVVLESMDEEKAVIMDPWDGKRKTYSSDKFFRAISSLRNKLKICPKVIEVSN